MITTTQLTMSGVAADLVVLYGNLRPWWKGNREAKQLADLGKGAGMGTLATLCPGGILGWTSHHSAVLANAGGQKVSSSVTGTSSGQSVAHQSMGTLSAAGAVLVVVATFATYLAWKDAGKRAKWRIVGGLFVGCTLCLTAGVAGALTWLPGVLNGLGESLHKAAQ
jgi:hypothetical protein